ncbi:MAG: bifunctional diaminohydroxyphosphoribosylaminopyrimidine deaminase/5-amino-6-(5-phosphoribosylamino)uracil reductase RibD [Ignavibacteria bacterium]|nr:bifunctional diaminohydroxyphosphoribosylaminopyrimidine deaminase/5-amino-6-(5-phosphoribosylamino)uracil reductase RibD [Ignavibacteria bacterium]
MAAEIDEFFMHRAIALAKRGNGRVSPNPLVGCVIVSDGEIVSEGWHAQLGLDHAENMAIKAASTIPANSVLYVTLEPCSHVGKTPACALEIIESGIKRVVIGCIDSNPMVSGKGAQMLVDHGVEVRIGVLEHECKWLVRWFLKHVSSGRPYVIGKIAQSTDGCIASADGVSKWISNAASRERVHALRSEIDAVMVGVNTVIADNPSLNTRLVSGRNPARIVVDSQLRSPINSTIISTATETKTFVICSTSASDDIKKQFVSAGVHLIEVQLTNGDLHLADALSALGGLDVTSILCEGGGHTMSKLLEHKLLDELHIFTSPIIMGRGLGWSDSFSRNPATAIQFNVFNTEQIGNDVHTILLPSWTEN